MNKDCKRYGCRGECDVCDGALAVVTQSDPKMAQSEADMWNGRGCLCPNQLQDALVSIRGRILDYNLKKEAEKL